MINIAKTSALGALTLCALAAPAYADPVAYGTTYGASARAEAGSQVDNIFSTITTLDGSVTNNQINQSDGGGGVSGSGSTTNSSKTYVPGVRADQTGTWANGPNMATTSASANLYNGTIHLSIVGTGPQRSGSPGGDASGTIGDLVTFKNTSGAVIDLGVSFSLDGTFSGSPVTGGGSFGHNVTANLEFTNPDGVVYPPPNVTFIGLKNPTTATVYTIGGTYYTNYRYQGQDNPFPYTAFTDNVGFSPANTAGPVSLSDLSTTTTLNVTQSTDLVIPTGVSRIDIGAFVNLQCTAPDFGGVSPTCDLSHTGILSFGNLPNGLTYTSDSGVFLTQSPTSGVPEPSTWAMIALGFACLGFGRGVIPASAGRAPRRG